MIEIYRREEIQKILRQREIVKIQAGWEWFEPEILFPQSLSGLDFEGVRFDAQNGLHVVVGRNNSGKTRLLSVMQEAKLRRTLNVDDLPQDVVQKVKRTLEGVLKRGADADLFSRVRMTWERLVHSPSSQYKSGSSFAVEFLTPSGKVHASAQYAETLIGQDMWGRLRLRPAMVVPTNRFIRDEGALNFNQAVATLDTFVPMLENLKRDYASECLYEEVASAFEDITDGLRLEFRGQGGTSVLHVREGGAPPTRLKECGDGLRDLVVILAYLAMFPSSDLMIDEPGLRLHPHAQRKLLGHLERAARSRAVWVASHDGTLVSSPSVKRHYAVRRDSVRACSYVKELPTQAELRDAFYELGWMPQDALLVDHVLYCEGPADKTVFDEVVRRLAETEPAFGGTLVVELGGDGAVWGKKPQALRSIEFLGRVAPHANHVIVLDKGDASEASVVGLIEWLESHGARVRFLKRNELENYFLEPALVSDLCGRALRWPRDWYRGDPATVGLPDVEKAAAMLAGKDLLAEKGSEILNFVFQEVFGKKYDKTQGAKAVVPVWQALAPTASSELMDEIKAALLETRDGYLTRK